MPENSSYKTPSDGLHACWAFVIHNKKKLDFSEDLSHLPCEQSRFGSYSETIRIRSNGAESRKEDYVFVFRREEKFVGQDDEKFTR